MTPEIFLDKFETLAATPNAAEKLRELVLALAVAGDQQNGHGTCPILPLKELASKIGSGATPLGGRETYLAKGVPLIRSMNVYYRGFQSEGLVYLSDQQAEELSNVEVQSGDVLLNITGASIGRVTVAPPEMAGARVNQHVLIIRPLATITSHFLAMYLASPAMQRMIHEMEVGATRQALTKGMVENFAIPVPPLAEQKRIVTKVDELMALCDRLEAQQQQREHAQAALTQAALARFADTPTPANLEYLFHHAYGVAPAEFREVILKVVVSGGFSSENTSRHIRLGEIIDLISGRHLQPDSWNQQERGIPYLTGPADFGPKHPVPTRWTETPEAVAEPGDILVTVKGAGVGKTNKLVAERTAISRQLMAVRVTAADPDFVQLVLQNAAAHFQSVMTGIAIPGIGRKDLLELNVELPSLAEQRRIVAKVNELMALVDELEAHLATAHTAAERLMDAVVAELTHEYTGHRRQSGVTA